MSLNPLDIIPWSYQGGTFPLTNYGANAIVCSTDTVPVGYIGILREINVIFTTGGGTLAFETRQSSGGTVRWTASITTNTNSGNGSLILGTGERFQIVITSTGAGVIDVMWQGYLQKATPPGLAFSPVPVNFKGTGGF